jgi:hypothetical protein
MILTIILVLLFGIDTSLLALCVLLILGAVGLQASFFICLLLVVLIRFLGGI